MVVKVATAGLQWSQPIVPHSPSSSQTFTCAISSLSSRRQNRRMTRLHRSALFPSPARLGLRSRTSRRSCTASSDSFSDEEFSKKIQELAMRFELSDDSESELASELLSEPVGWSPGEEIIPASVERRANSIELPVSLRMIKRKMQWEGSLTESGESAYCSVKKAFSSMVFIIRELHSYTLQMREILYYEDLQGVLRRVQKEIHASFVWLFQQVFSHTPTLMVYVMILMVNFTVFSMGSNAALAANPTPPAALTETVSVRHVSNFDPSAVKTFSVSSLGKSTTVNGGGGGDGSVRPVGGGTDGDGALHSASSVGPVEAEKEAMSEEEVALWNSVVAEAVDREKVVVAPVSVAIESDRGYEEYVRTEIFYQMGLEMEPNNSLLLANYAQFLYLVVRDFDR